MISEPGVLRRARRAAAAACAVRAMRVRQLEIPYGAFERRIPLPPGRLEIGPPELAHGCLVLRLRKL